MHWAGEGTFQVPINALDPRPSAQQGELFVHDNTRTDGVNAVIDAINEKYGASAVHRAKLLGRAEAPDVISPGWQPSGHRESIEY